MRDSNNRTSDAATAMDARAWTRILASYRRPSNGRSIVEIGITVVPLVVCWVLVWATLDLGYWFSLLLAVPAAGFLVRLFMIQHDCGHGAFFRHRLANDWVGRIIGVLTLTPYDFWRRTHALHHASSGNLDRRGFGDINTLTVREYRARSLWGRLCYRLYRHPLVMFGIGPAYLFILQHRLPVGLMRAGWQPWLSTMTTNFAIALVVGHADLVHRGQGIPAGPPADHAPCCLCRRVAVLCAAPVRAHLWEDDGNWSLHEAALHGSSHYDLPAILRWFTANIGVHHVHHLCSRIPYYRLPQALRDHPSCVASAASRCCRAFAACGWRCGTRRSAGSSHSAKSALEIGLHLVSIDGHLGDVGR